VKSQTVLLLLLSIAATSCLFHKEPAVPGVLPKEAAKALDDKYAGWTLAEFSGGDAACSTRAGSSPTQVNDDFNTDGFGDWALELHQGDSVKLVVVMGWLADFRVYEIESAQTDKAARFLTHLKRGTKYINPVTQSDEYLSHNSLVTQSCAGDQVFYLWNGDGFRRLVTAKAPAPGR
jgi:hypothetical protein